MMAEPSSNLPRVVMYTGKGGTGKSVISCATGLKSAELGHDTLIMSSDPAHTLADALGKQIGDEPSRISQRLWGIQVNPVEEMNRNYAVIQEYVASVLSAKGLDETLAYEIASLPTMTQLFAFLKVQEFAEQDRFDVLVLDTVPAGEALRYLYFPRLVGSVSRKVMRMVAPMAGLARALEPILGVPTPRREVIDTHVSLIESFERVNRILSDPSVSSVRLVANPDSFSIQNTKRTLMTSNLYGINVDLAIMNKVLPDEIQDPYLKKWMQLQERMLREAEISFYPVPIEKVPLYSSELKGLRMLKRCGEALFAEDDPASVFFKGKPFRVECDENTCELTVSVPFTEKEDFGVERIGDEIIVKVRTNVGAVANVIPLPAVTARMRLVEARLLSRELHVRFVREDERRTKVP